MMTQIRGSSNAKARRELGWRPAGPSWRDGFARGLTRSQPATMDAGGRKMPGVKAGEVPEQPRPLPFSIAYRMLGSVSDAEDIVQEAFPRCHRAFAGQPGPTSPKACLSAVITRLCIDQLRSARARREVYIGEWLPEPPLTDAGAPDTRPGWPRLPTRCPRRSYWCLSGCPRCSGRSPSVMMFSVTATATSPRLSAGARPAGPARPPPPCRAPAAIRGVAAQAGGARGPVLRRPRRRCRGLRRRGQPVAAAPDRRHWPGQPPDHRPRPADSRAADGDPPGRDQRSARRAVPRPGWPPDQRSGPGHRGRTGTRDPVGDQSRQAATPRSARRRRRPAPSAAAAGLTRPQPHALPLPEGSPGWPRQPETQLDWAMRATKGVASSGAGGHRIAAPARVATLRGRRTRRSPGPARPDPCLPLPAGSPGAAQSGRSRPGRRRTRGAVNPAVPPGARSRVIPDSAGGTATARPTSQCPVRVNCRAPPPARSLSRVMTDAVRRAWTLPRVQPTGSDRMHATLEAVGTGWASASSGSRARQSILATGRVAVWLALRTRNRGRVTASRTTAASAAAQ